MNNFLYFSFWSSKRDETLVIVTADHADTLKIRESYPSPVDSDELPSVENQRNDESENESIIAKTDQQADIESESNAQAGSDVTIYATGPMAHLVQRVHEQSYVAHLISYAARIGRFRHLA